MIKIKFEENLFRFLQYQYYLITIYILLNTKNLNNNFINNNILVNSRKNTGKSVLVLNLL